MPKNNGKGLSAKNKQSAGVKNVQSVEKDQPKKVTQSEKDQSKNVTSKLTISSNTNVSKDIICELCQGPSDPEQWLVQCDDCSKFFHFECVGITSIEEEDPWSCSNCTKNKEKSAYVQNRYSADPSKRVSYSKGKFEQNLKCDSCGVTSPEWKRYVQCDVCDKIYHFECAKISELYEEDFWNCNECQNPNKTVDRATTQSSNEQPRTTQSQDNETSSLSEHTPQEIIVEADVIAEQTPRIEDKEDRRKNIIPESVDQIEVQSSTKSLEFDEGDLDAKKSSTRAPSLNPRYKSSKQTTGLKSRTVSLNTRSSASSQRLERVQAELELQEKIDEEKLEATRSRMNAEVAIRLEALKAKAQFEKAKEALKLQELEMREKRERKFLADQARSSQSGSMRSTSSNATNRTSYVSSWIEDLSKHESSGLNVTKISQEGENVEPDSSKVRNPTILKTRSESEKLHQKSELRPSEGWKKSESVNKNDQHTNTKGKYFDWSIYLSEAEKTEWKNQQSKDAFTKPSETEAAFHSYSQTGTKFSKNISSGKPKTRSYPETTSHFANTDPRVKGYDTRNWKGQTQSTQMSQSNAWKNCQSNGTGVTFSGTNQDQRTQRSQNYDNQSQPLSGRNHQHDHHGWSQPEHRIVTAPETYQEPNQDIYANEEPVKGKNHLANPTKQIGSPLESNSRPNHVPLTAEQIAARQVMGRNQLPMFTGNPIDWLRFIHKYDSSTANCGFSNVENLDRLDKCIQDKARDIVESLLNLPQCVPEIIDTLRQKFGRPEIIIQTVLTKIRKEPAIKPDRLEALSNYGYKVRNVRNTIESLHMHYHLYNPELTQELVDKLPHQTKIEWARYSESISNVSLVHFSDWLYRLSTSLNRITMPEISTTSNDRKSDRKTEESKVKAVGYVNVHDNNSSKQVRDNQKSKSKRCLICASDCKFPGECEKFKGLVVEERWKALFEHKLCRRCLRKHGGLCRIAKDCGENGCTAKHHSLMHNDKKNSKGKSSNQSVSTETKSTATTTGSANTHHDNDEDTLFRIVPVEVHNNNKSIQTFAFLDEGSSYTMMERDIAKKIDTRGTPEMICLLWTKKVSRVEQSELANLEISGIHESTPTRYPLRSVNIVDDLDLPIQTLNCENLVQQFPHLRKLPLPEFKDVKPTMIIGLKHARLSTPLETIEGAEDDPIATRCRLGWSVHGPTNNTNTGYVNMHRISQCPCQDRDDNLHDMIKEHFTVENFGVAASSMSLESKDNEAALELLKKFTLRKGNRFETRLLWKDESCELPNSYPMAMKRLSCLENKGPEVINTINDFIDDYIEKGYVSKLTPDEIAKKYSRTWYLPLFTVTHPKKPEKLRPVFDGAARVKGISLNSALYTGPDLLVSIVDVLRRFREHKIAFSGDIKEMYHQVKIHKDDRNSQRFLWRNGERSREPDVYVMNVMTFGATCSPSAAQFVKNTNASEFQSKFPRAAEAIVNNHYVDDLMDGTATVEDGIQLVNEVKFIHRQAGFEIRNFKSNSLELLKAIGEQVTFDEKVSVESESMIERVLGMFWDTRVDCFTFSLKFTKVTSDILSGKQLPTKREALRLLMSIFDPLGLLSYYLIHLKILIQDVWRSEAKWDDQIPEDLQERWIRWVNILPNVVKLKIPRCYSINLSSEIKKVEIHIFVDAGEDAFAAVAYLKIETGESCECSLVGSKARVAPLKHLSIPRKELQAAVLGSRLLTSISNGQTFKIDRRIIWSDSETVLSWLKSNSRKYSQFVAHRVGEVLESTLKKKFRLKLQFVSEIYEFCC